MYFIAKKISKNDLERFVNFRDSVINSNKTSLPKYIKLADEDKSKKLVSKCLNTV